MKPLLLITTLFLLAFSASAQTQRSSASQVVSITIQKVTLLKFQDIPHLVKDLSLISKEVQKENKQVHQKDILVTMLDDETYVKRNEEQDEMEDTVAVTTQTSL